MNVTIVTDKAARVIVDGKNEQDITVLPGVETLVTADRTISIRELGQANVDQTEAA